MSQLHAVHIADDTPESAVVFVHGLDGHPTATWQLRDLSTFWPGWLGQDLKCCNVYSLEYDASSSGWFGSAMALPQRAANVLATLDVELPDKVPVVFVCHSLGGLVVKQSLRKDWDLAGPGRSSLAQRTAGVVFIATPNAGSRISSLMTGLKSVFRINAPVEEMQHAAPHLLDLSDWYRSKADDIGIKTLVFVETQPTKGVTVVDAASANPGLRSAEVVPIDADHISICKPTNRDATLYKKVRQFAEQALREGAQKQSKLAQKAMLGPSPKRYDVFLSHSSAQKEWVEALAQNLDRAGKKVFLDSWCLVPGRDFVDGLKRGLSESRSAVLVVSPNSFDSGWVREEFDALKRRQQREPDLNIIPVIHSTVEGKSFFPDNTQWVDFRASGEAAYRTAFARLLCGLENRAPGPNPSYTGNLTIPVIDEMPTSDACVGEVVEDTFSKLFNANTVIILSQDGWHLSAVTKEVRDRAKERFGDENVGLAVLSHTSTDDSEADYFFELADQLNIETEVTSASAFRRSLGSRVRKLGKYCLILSGVENSQKDMLNLLASVLRVLSDRNDEFKVIICGGEKLCDLKYAAGDHSYLNHATEIRWPELTARDVQHIASGSGLNGLDEGRIQRILAASGGHAAVTRELCFELQKRDEAPLEEAIATSPSLWNAFAPLRRQENLVSEIKDLTQSNSLGPYHPYFTDKAVRKLYWMNIIKRQDDELRWRSPAIKSAVVRILDAL